MAKHLPFPAATTSRPDILGIAKSLGAPRASHGNVIRHTPLAFRVTRNTPVERALDVERRRREVFVSTLAHELRQPLATLLAAVEGVHQLTDPDKITPGQVRRLPPVASV